MRGEKIEKGKENYLKGSEKQLFHFLWCYGELFQLGVCLTQEGNEMLCDIVAVRECFFGEHMENLEKN